MQDTSSIAGARPLRSRATTVGGTLEQYAAVVGPAHLGAVTHGGKVNWPYLLPP